MASFPIKEWLQTGWLLELRAVPGGAGSRFWLGWGERPKILNSLDKIDFERSGGAWHPDFFDGSARFVSGASATAESVELSRLDFENLLAQAWRDWIPAAREPAIREPAVARVDWQQLPERAAFAKGFERASAQLRSGEFSKLVPVVFSHGLAAAADREHWLLERLRFGVQSTRGSALRLYGMWRSEGNLKEGFVGATPEDLFRVEPAKTHKLATMAVAGTRPLERAAELLTADKDLYEHALVVEYLRDTLTPLASSPVQVGRTEVEPFGTLAHLVTEVHAELKPGLSIQEIVRTMHPTPALGYSPRKTAANLPSANLSSADLSSANLSSADLSPLKALDQLTCPGEERLGFGAPFVVSRHGRTEAVVAIRQVSFSSSEGEQLKLRIGSGCGIVKGSELEAEWQELSFKRRAVSELFGLQAENYDAVRESLLVLQLLFAVGAREFVVCAGARNAPLVVALEHLRRHYKGAEAIHVNSFFDERSAAFFALGRSRRDSLRPVVVITTSGTAATELHSAMAEADHSGVPLVALTADRPRRLRGTGAPQSIDQTALYQHSVEWSHDIEAGHRADFNSLRSHLATWSLLRPIHINLSLDEPLNLQGDVQPELLSAAPNLHRHVAAFDLGYDDARLIGRFVQEGALTIVGRLEAFEREPVLQFLRRARMPVWLEGPSGLRGHVELQPFEVTGDDSAISLAIASGVVKRILRLGAVPTLRAWRDLDEPAVACETLSVSRLRFSGLGRGHHFQAELEGLRNVEIAAASEAALAPLRARLVHSAVPLNSLYYKLSRLIPQDAKVYVGNSLPIREWDRSATRDCVRMIEANRGVNGIDGQISTALGLAQEDDELWVIVGDLTALYDLNSPWAPRPKRLRIVVVNNGGGQIFSKVLKAPMGSALFVNAHEHKVKGFAEQWGLGYLCLEAESLDAGALNSMQDQMVLEIIEDMKVAP